jgi:hypothetical protein
MTPTKGEQMKATRTLRERIELVTDEAKRIELHRKYNDFIITLNEALGETVGDLARES